MTKRTGLLGLLVAVSAVFMLGAAGCASKQKTAEAAPAAAAEKPAEGGSEHPKGEHPSSEHPK